MAGRLPRDTLPITWASPGLEIPYAAGDLVQPFLKLTQAQRCELLWLLNLYMDAPEPDADESAPPMNVDPEGE